MTQTVELHRFNPTMVRLLPDLPAERKQVCRFNPTMVRLLHKGVRSTQVNTHGFQSHNGAIAAGSGWDDTTNAALVSIPQWCDCCTHFRCSCDPFKPSFNPTMVRLLRQTNLKYHHQHHRFNPTMVRLLRGDL